MEALGVKVIEAQDWSLIEESNLIPKDSNIAASFDKRDISGLGIYRDEGQCYSSSYVGIRKLRTKERDFVIVDDESQKKELAVCIKPRFGMNQWDMLLTVMQDPEYGKYTEGHENKFFEIFYEEGTIRTSVETNGGELILILSFLKACQSICRKQLKAQMQFAESNFNGNVRGSIRIDKHIKENIIIGREDRIYCRYPDFSIDTLENRILKKSLLMSEKMLNEKKVPLPELRGIIQFCKNSLRNVSTVKITKSDFGKVNVSGFNSYYKKSIELAKLITLHCGMNISSEDINTTEEDVIPYLIKIETLFEYYVRAKFKEYFKTKNISNLKLDDYRRPRDSGALTTYSDTFVYQRPYLMNEYIPDILLKKQDDSGNWYNIAVFDVKYQHSMKAVMSSTRRHNSHQLLFYMLLSSVDKCGFIFPNEPENVNTHLTCELNLNDGNVVKSERQYSQWEIDLTKDVDAIFDELIVYVTK